MVGAAGATGTVDAAVVGAAKRRTYFTPVAVFANVTRRPFFRAIVRFPPANAPPATWTRIALRLTPTSLNVASPMLNSWPTPTTMRRPFVQSTAAVGLSGRTGRGFAPGTEK